MTRNCLILLLIFLINILIIYLISTLLQEPLYIIVLRSSDENSPAESSTNNDRWRNINDLLTCCNEDFLALTALFVITLHLVLMRGCARFVINYFLPFYTVSIPLLIAILTISFFELNYLNDYRNLCLMLIGGIITAMAFLTPFYFVLCDVEEKDGPDHQEEVDDYEQTNKEDTPPPPPYDAPNYALVRKWDNTDTDCPRIVDNVTQAQKDVSLLEDEVAKALQAKSDTATESNEARTGESNETEDKEDSGENSDENIETNKEDTPPPSPYDAPNYALVGKWDNTDTDCPRIVDNVTQAQKDASLLEDEVAKALQAKSDTATESNEARTGESNETEDKEDSGENSDENIEVRTLEVETRDSDGIKAGHDEREGLTTRKRSRSSTFFN